jgi:hypothetical protein
MAEPAGIPSTALCRIAILEPVTYGRWRKKGLILAKGPEFTEDDAVEIAVIGLLNRSLSKPVDFDMAARRLRGKLKRALLDRAVLVVCHLSNRDAELCFSDAEVARAVALGGEVQVIAANVEIGKVVRGFRKELSDIRDRGRGRS